MPQLYADSLRIMRVALGRRNVNDPDSDDETFYRYINDAITLTMTDDVKVFEQFGTLEFVINENDTTGVKTFNDVGASSSFSNISMEGFISLTDPPDESVSWNRLSIYMDPGIFYDIWGVNNTDVLVAGYPTEMLYYGDQMVFRTIPNTSYTVTLYGYKILDSITSSADPTPGKAEIPFAYWLRYVAYLAAYNYATDYRFAQEETQRIKQGYQRERKFLLTRTHNQRKVGRCQPQF